MSRVLVTGASGFVGGHLVAALTHRGDDVRALVRPTSDVRRLKQLDVELLCGDIADADSVARAVDSVDVVYHVAGAIKARRYADLLRSNEQGVENVASACAACPAPPVLVVVSSLAAAGPAPPDRPLVESDAPRPVSNYGRSKLRGELAALRHAAAVPITVVRPPIVFGEADPAMALMFRPIARLGIHLVPSWRSRRFSLIHAADLAEALILAAHRGTRLEPAAASSPQRPAGYYFVADRQQPTYAQLGRMIGQAVGRSWVIVLPVPQPLAWPVAAASDLTARLRGRTSILSIDKMREATAGSWTCSPQRAEEELGFCVAAPLADRLAQTARWYRSAGWI